MDLTQALKGAVKEKKERPVSDKTNISFQVTFSQKGELERLLTVLNLHRGKVLDAALTALLVDLQAMEKAGKKA